MKIIGVPKTIDNDLEATDITFGYDSALAVATEAIDRLQTTASAHHRVMVVEVMGRYAGWIALGAGLAGGADMILIPEIPFKWDAVFDFVWKRSKGARFSIICVSEVRNRSMARLLSRKKISSGPIRFASAALQRLSHSASKKKQNSKRV